MTRPLLQSIQDMIEDMVLFEKYSSLTSGKAPTLPDFDQP